MNGAVQLFEPFARTAVSLALNALWQDAVIVAAVSLLLRVWKPLSAATRYAAWFVALVAAIALPIGTMLWAERPQPSSATATVVERGEPLAVRSKTPLNVQTRRNGSSAPPAQSAPSLPAFAPPRVVTSAALLEAIAALWGLAAIALLLRLGVGLFKLERLKKNALPLPIAYRDRLARCGAASHGGRAIRLCVSDETVVPVAVGLFDSMILLPHHLLDELSGEELEQVCLHEISHLRRADDWTNLVQRLILALAWFSPALYAVALRLDLEREAACDDDVVGDNGPVRPYAHCLTRMAEITVWPHRALAAPGVFVTRRGISERIERLLSAKRRAVRGLAFAPVAVVLAGLAVLGVAMHPVAVTAIAPGAQRVALHARATASVARVRPVRRVAQTIVQTTVAPATPRPSRPRAARRRAAPAGVGGRSIPVRVPAVRVDVPALHFDVAGTHVDVPAVHVNVPGKTLHVATADTRGCSGCDLSGVNWSGRDLRGRSFAGTDFSDARLVGADFSRSDLSGSDFEGANLEGAHFDGAKLSGCDFENTNLRDATLHGALVQGCDFDAALLDSSQAREILQSCVGCDMSHHDFAGANFSGLSLDRDDLSHSNLSGVDFSHTVFKDVDFEDTTLNGARFVGATLIKCDLDGVDTSHVDLSGARLIDTETSR